MIILSDFASNNGLNPAGGRPADEEPRASRWSPSGSGRRTPARLARHQAPRHRRQPDRVRQESSSRSRARSLARGFANQTLDVELFVEGQADAVAKTQVKVPDGADVIPITGLKYIPQTPGEKMITLKVAAQDGELLKSNNEISTFVTVLSGGLNVLFLQGSNWSWDYKYMMRSIATSQDIQVEGVRDPGARPGGQGRGRRRRVRAGPLQRLRPERPPGRLSDPEQQRLLVEAVRKGAGPHDARRPFQLRRRRLGRHAACRTSCRSTSTPATASSSPRAASSSSPTPRGSNSYVLQVGAQQDRDRADLGRDEADPGDQPLRRGQARRRHPRRDARPQPRAADGEHGGRHRAGPSPTAATPGSGTAPRRRAGSPIASSGVRSFSGSRTRRTKATTRSR